VCNLLTKCCAYESMPCLLLLLLLHMLMINRVITLPTVSAGYSELYCGSAVQSVASQNRELAEQGAGVTEIACSLNGCVVKSGKFHSMKPFKTLTATGATFRSLLTSSAFHFTQEPHKNLRH